MGREKGRRKWAPLLEQTLLAVLSDLGDTHEGRQMLLLLVSLNLRSWLTTPLGTLSGRTNILICNKIFTITIKAQEKSSLKGYLISTHKTDRSHYLTVSTQRFILFPFFKLQINFHFSCAVISVVKNPGKPEKRVCPDKRKGRRSM